MTKRVKMVTKGSYTKRGVLSLKEVRTQTQAYWLHISTSFQETTSMGRVFGRQKIPCPAQYAGANAALAILHRSLREFGAFLDNGTRLPLAVCAARYPLIKALHLMDAQVGELNILTTLLCMSGQLSSQETFFLLQDVRQKLKEIQRSWNSIRRGTQVLLNRTQIPPEEQPPRLIESNIIEFDRRKTTRQEKRSRVL